MAVKPIRLVAGLTLVAAVTAACSSGVSTNASGRMPNAASAQPSMSSSVADRAISGTAATKTAAAETLAVLTAQLQEHVYLAGIATGTALSKGADSADFKAASGELDKNSVKLSQVVGSVYGDAGGKQFLDLWRKHIGFFVDYTVGAATKDQAKKQQAVKDLDGYRADFGAFLESATEGALTKDAVAQELSPHVQTLAAAVDAQAAKSPDQFAKLRAAAEHMPMTAAVLAGAIDNQKGLDGDVNSAAAKTRAVLTAQLQEHVYLAGIATGTALGQGADSAMYEAAAGELDKNSVALSQTVASVYGDAGGKQFLDLWRKHIGFFVDYTIGAATKDNAKKAKAVQDLDGYRADFGAFLESATEGGLPKDAVAAELVPHVQSLAAAVDAQAANSPTQFAKLHASAHHMPMTAGVLAGAIAEQKKLAG